MKMHSPSRNNAQGMATPRDAVNGMVVVQLHPAGNLRVCELLWELYL